MQPRWEHFEHEADVGVRGFGATPAGAFEQAALALTAVITDPSGLAAREQAELDCTAENLDELLFAFLNAVVYETSTRGLLFGRYQVQIDGTHLLARAWGEPVDRARHRPAVEVKAATLCELAVRQEPGGGWRAQCVVDV